MKKDDGMDIDEFFERLAQTKKDMEKKGANFTDCDDDEFFWRLLEGCFGRGATR